MSERDAGLVSRFVAAAHAHRAGLVHEATRCGAGLDAEDVVQDALVKAWLGLGGFVVSGVSGTDSAGGDPDRAMAGWLFTIARNGARDWRNHLRVLPMLRYDPAVYGDATERLAPDYCEPEAAYLAAEAHRERRAVVAGFLQKLPPHEAQTLWATSVPGEGAGTVGRRTGRGRIAVKAERHRALVRCRRLAAIGTIGAPP